jgi:hypothetical protein
LATATNRPVIGLQATAYHPAVEGKVETVVHIFPSSEYAAFADPPATVTNRPVGLHATDRQYPAAGGVAETDHVEPLSEYRDDTIELAFETRTNLFVVGFILGETAGVADFPEKY